MIGSLYVWQVRKAKGMKKCDKIVLDSQERAFWRVNRPPPGFLNSLEYVPVPSRNRSSKPKKRSLEDVQRDVRRETVGVTSQSRRSMEDRRTRAMGIALPPSHSLH